MKELFIMVCFVVGMDILYNINPDFAFTVLAIAVAYAINDTFN